MEEQGDIPLAVWAWNGHKLVIVWGVYALNALRKSAQKLLPGAIANNRPSVSGEFEILVFTKIDGDKYDLLAYGGTPVLCYNVLSSIMPSTNVFTRLMNHFKQSRVFPTIWAFNPQVACESQNGIEVRIIKEGDEQHMQTLFGRDNIDEWKQIAHDTNALPVESNGLFSFEEEEEEEGEEIFLSLIHI